MLKMHRQQLPLVAPQPGHDDSEHYLRRCSLEVYLYSIFDSRALPLPVGERLFKVMLIGSSSNKN